MKVLLGVTASIASCKIVDLIRDLKQEGFDVTAAMTRDAHHFVTPLVLQTYTGNEVVNDLFAAGGARKVVHIGLARSVDAVLVAPATADVIAKLACGLADDVLTCTALSTDAPVIVAPAMNDRMYRHPATQENIARLKRMGYVLVGPIRGRLACAEEGIGHIATNEAIIGAVKNCLSKKKKP